MQKSLQAGREYTNIRYSTESGLTPVTTSPQSQPALESPTSRLSKSTLSLANPPSSLSGPNHGSASLKPEKITKEPKNNANRSTVEHLQPMY